MCETYQEHLTRLVHSLGRGSCHSILEELQAGSMAERLQMFVDGNSEKRFEKLSDQLEFVAEAFDDFERLIEVYVRQRPLAAFDTVVTDAERMLLWLLDNRSLSPVQRDYILCQRARHAVEELARCHRPGHLAFQKLRRLQGIRGQAVDLDSSLLHLNPVRASATFITTALLDSQATAPTEALFFPDGHEIATVVLEPDALAALLTLVGAAPCSFETWQRRSGTQRGGQLRATAFSLLDLGLLAAEAN